MTDDQTSDGSLGAEEDLLSELAHDFATRLRQGEQPTVEEYVCRYPSLADRLRTLFPALMTMEQSCTGTDVSLPPAGERAGATIGRYKLLERIGEGGFGTVFMAEQQHPMRRRVALKVLKPGVDTRQVIARFEAERQALALMDHPNIAQVFDAGETASGRPYFVMELVRGIPITAYCDQGKLPLRERLELFVHVCQAVQHAHHKGIVHRDIKPSNILVTLHDGLPVVKVIDFGIAKATAGELTDKTLFTGFAQVVGTPLYASPEQVDLGGLDIDTRTDVYSLGVLLYELLTGTTPFKMQRLQQAAYDEMRRIIREEDPPRPSTRMTAASQQTANIAAQRASQPRRLAQIFRGELDWIVMKALEKDRTRRYDTPLTFADDISRYLANDPVEARPPSTAYRVTKFVRRHAWGTSVAAAAVLLLGLSTFLVWNQQRKTAAALAESQKQSLMAQDNLHLAVQARDQVEAKRQEMRRALYASELNLAGQAAEAFGALGRVDEILMPWQQSHPDLRGWEWYFLDGLCHRDLQTLRGHKAGVSCVAWRSDGLRLASASRDCTLKIWEPATGSEILTLTGHTGEVRWAAWSPNGKQLASSGQDRTVKIWDAATGRQALNLAGHTDDVQSVAWSPDGKSVASASLDGTIRIWDVTDGREVLAWVGHRSSVVSVAWSPDGKRLASGGRDNDIKLWDAANGKELFSMTGATSSASTGTRSWKGITVTWSPDGSRLAWTDPRGAAIIVCDLADGGQRRFLDGHKYDVSGLSWSPDGTLLASCSLTDCTIRVWEARSGREIGEAREVVGGVEFLAWSPDGKRLAAAGQEIKIWNAVSTSKMHSLGEEHDGALSVAWSPDDTRFAVAGEVSTIKIRDRDSGELLHSLPGHGTETRSVVWSPDGRLLASAGIDRTIRIWNAMSGKELRAIKSLYGPAPPPEPGQDSIGVGVIPALMFLAWSPDGRQLASVCGDTTIQIWDPSTGREVRSLKGHAAQVLTLAWHPDSRRLATGAADGSVKIWDAGTGRVISTISEDLFGGPTWAVQWSPNGQRLCFGARDCKIRMWDPATGQILVIMSGHSNIVRCLAWHPDGTRLASGGKDEYIRIWDTSTGEQLLALHQSSQVWSLDWTLDGRCLAAGVGAGPNQIYDAAPGYAAHSTTMPAGAPHPTPAESKQPPP